MPLSQAEYSARYRQRHPDRSRASSKKYKETHPETAGATQKRKKLLQAWFLGTECRACGWNEYPEGLHAHHVDPSTKHPRLRPGGIGIYKLGIEEAENEYRKCIALCANCHAGVEAGRITLTPEQSRTLA